MSASKVAAEWAKGWPKLVAKQKAIQSAPGFVHRKEGDMITSKVIPLALTAVSTVLLVPGLFRMYLGLHD